MSPILGTSVYLVDMLAHEFASADLKVIDHDTTAPPGADDLRKLSAPLSDILTAELDGAQGSLRVPTVEILLAALGPAISRTIGDGMLAVDVAGRGRSIPLTCIPLRETDATELLAMVHHTLATVPAASRRAARKPSDVLLSCGAPGRPAKGATYALELWVYRADGVLQLDWWYDSRRMDEYTVEELSEQFPLALIEVTSEAISPIGPGFAAVG
jgi:hypothetical protein